MQGLLQCSQGTLMENSRLLHLTCVNAIYLELTSLKGIPRYEDARDIGVSQRELIVVTNKAVDNDKSITAMLRFTIQTVGTYPVLPVEEGMM